MYTARGRNADAFVALKMVTTENLDTSALSSSSQHCRVVMQCKTLGFYFWIENVKDVHCAVGNVTRLGCVQCCRKRGSSEAGKRKRWGAFNPWIAEGESHGCALLQTLHHRDLLSLPSLRTRADDVKTSRVQETHPSPETQRIAAEVCNHDP